MAAAKEIRTKIASVKNTQKITKAMEMVAASKMRRAQDRMASARPYADKMRQGFKALGFHVLDAQTAIVPVIIGEDMLTFKFWRELFDAGVFVNAFVSPGVPPGMAMLRTSYMATHEDKHLDRILETFSVIGKKLGVIS